MPSIRAQRLLRSIIGTISSGIGKPSRSTVCASTTKALYSCVSSMNKFLYIFDDWGFQIPLLPADLAHMKDKPVDLYLSMKVTGDVSCEDAENYPVYSIDRVVAVERCESFGEDYPTEIPATCMKNAARSGGICGQSIRLIFTCFGQQLYELYRGVHRDRRFAVILGVPRHDAVHAGAHRRLDHHGILEIGNLR